MIKAAALALGSGLLGGAIALLARKHPAVLERTRTFAFAAAAGVVAFHLLPEVLLEQGLVALLWMGGGFALPWALEAGARAVGPSLLESRGFTGARVAAEVGFAALIFHSVAEGLALVAALAQPKGQFDLEVALVAHHAPLTAAVVLPFLDLRGARAAAFRAASIGVAGLCGVLLSALLPGFSEGAFLRTATAITAGALLHVVSDEIRPQRFGSGWGRAADLAACIAGLLLAGLAAALHLGDSGPLLEFLRVFGGIALASAPALLCGAIAAALFAQRARLLRWDAMLLALPLLGTPAALAFAVLSTALSFPVASVVLQPASTAGVLDTLVASIRRHAPSLLALIVVAAAIEVSAPSLVAHRLTAAILLAGLALCARLDEAGAVTVAAVLVHKDADPGLAVALLALGPLTRSAVLHSLTAARTVLLVAVAIGGGAALSWSRWIDPARAAARVALALVRDPLLVQAAASPLGAASAAALLAIALATLWTAGVRGWFAPLRHGAGPA